MDYKSTFSEYSADSSNIHKEKPANGFVEQWEDINNFEKNKGESLNDNQQIAPPAVLPASAGVVKMASFLGIIVLFLSKTDSELF